MKATLNLRVPGVIRNPGLDRPAQRYASDVVRAFIYALRSLIGGAGVVQRQSLYSGTRRTATLEYSVLPARAVVTCAAVANADTITLNGQALTAGQKRASCTVTFSSLAADDTVTVNGTVFTAKVSASGNYQFALGANDTAAASNFVTKLNAATTNSADAVNGAGVYGKIESSSSAGAITLYAIAEGTAGNAYTIATSNGTRAAITNDSSGFFANGAAAANNAFDYVGGNIRTARSVCDCVAASSTAAVSSHVTASCRQATIACSNVSVGDWVELDGFKLYANATATDSGGNRIATIAEDQWCQGSTDTNDGTSLVNCIHAHPVLAERFFAVNSSGTVTIYERAPEASEAPTVSSSNGTRLAVTATNGKFADGAAVLFTALRPGVAGNVNTIATGNGTRLAITQDSSGRLTGGTSTTLSF